ncbi:hypothetical protein DFH06DRAFT_264157 [Mycena polygramma]|nr:hypothetical protein DFH06DRAFT_264157 [Mycena polygramma]
MHRCGVCKKEFPRPSAVRTHMHVHDNERPYTCGFPDCPKTFSVRSNARRHYRTHGVRSPQPDPDSPIESQADFKFAEPIDAPVQPPPPPLSLSQAPFRVRWVPTNKKALSKAGHSTKRLEKNLNQPQPEKLDDSQEQEMQQPMFLYDPFPTAGPSTDEPPDMPGMWGAYPPCEPSQLIDPNREITIFFLQTLSMFSC